MRPSFFPQTPACPRRVIKRPVHHAEAQGVQGLEWEVKGQGRRTVPPVGCLVQGVGVGCRVLHHLAAERLARRSKALQLPPPSHLVVSCCCALLSKPKCFLISLLHFPESSPCWRPRTWHPRAISASGAQSAHQVQAARSSYSWCVALGPCLALCSSTADSHRQTEACCLGA